MRSFAIMAVAVLAVGTAQAQVKGQVVTRPGITAPAKSSVQLTATNAVYRSLKNPQIVYSGTAVQAAKSRNPLQLVNPLAPVSYGSGEANTSRDITTGRVEGFKLFSISFW